MSIQQKAFWLLGQKGKERKGKKETKGGGMFTFVLI
jgi:hypothetical protein